MTKRDYVHDHPRDTITAKLRQSILIGDDDEIEIIGGLPHGRNLRAAGAYEPGAVLIRGGHRWRGTEGWWWAVCREPSGTSLVD
jgi:hypothetical protein